MSEFVSAPPPTGGINWEDHNGKLLIVEPLAVETGIQTQYGLSDAVRANVYVLTGPNEAEEFNDTLIFPKLLQSQTRSQIGKKVVGRLGQGLKKAGQNPPWIIEEAAAEDIEKAKSYLANKGVTSAPQPQQTAEAPF
jgi:hypothetical protein